MREIKFRAWDKKRQKWVGPNLHMEVVSGLLFWQFGLDCNLMGMDSNYGRDIYILQQYTGLKDKNGKEIYEGDIIKRPEGTHGYEVKFLDGAFRPCFLGTNNPIAGEHLLWYQADRELKVIGNIYENPELLEENKK